MDDKLPEGTKPAPDLSALKPTAEDFDRRIKELQDAKQATLAEIAGGQKITKGRVVLVYCYGRSMSKEFEHPGIVTKVHPAGVINVMVLPDLHTPFGAEKAVYSDVPLQDKPVGYSWRWPTKV